MKEDNPFRFVSDVQKDKKYIMLTEQDEKEYNSFLTNRALSMHIDSILHTEIIGRYPDIPNKWAYDYYFHSLRQMKRPFQKWPKKVKDEDLEIIMEYYQISRVKAEYYQELLSNEQITKIKEDMEKGGFE